MPKAKPAPTPPKLFSRERLLTSEVVAGLVIGLLATGALIWRICAITGNQISSSELATKHQLYINSPWWKSLANLNGPYYLLLHGTLAISRSVWAFRLASVIVGLLTVICIYWLVSRWHGFKIGLLAALVLLCNFGFLVVSRQAITLAVQLLVVSLLLVAIALIYETKNLWSLLYLILIAAGSLYTPGAIYLVIATGVITYKPIKEIWASLNLNQKLTAIAIKLALLAPLIYRLARFYSAAQLKNWLGWGLSGKFTHIGKTFGLNFMRAPLDLFVHSSKLDPSLSIGHLPLIPITDTFIALIAIYFYVTRISNYRWRSVIILFLVGWLSIGLGVFSVYSLIPLVAVAIGTGLAYLLKEWFTVFPKNPYARYGGLALLSLVIIFSCFYSLRSYFVAWANNPSSSSQFTNKL